MDLVNDLVSLAATYNLSLFQMCLAAYILFLYKLTNEQDICVGVVTANRYRPEQNDLIGMFVNLFPYRIKIDNNDQNLKSYYTKIHQLCLDFMRYEHLPLQEIVKLHRTSHDQLNHSPFFQTTLAFYSNTCASHIDTCSFDNILCKSIDLPISVVKFDLCLVINHTLINNNRNQYQQQQPQHNMSCKWEYSSRLYQENDIQILSDRLISFLTSLIDAEKITQLSVLIPRDFKISRQLNNTHLNFDHSTTFSSIHANFDMHVKNNPLKTAVIADGLSFTYHEINQKAIKLASYLLQSYNIHPGDVIIQCVNRGIEMVIGILAILKVRGIYCPLNPMDPSRRHISLINDIKSSIILCDQSTYSTFQTINDNTDINHYPLDIVNITEILRSKAEIKQFSFEQSITTANDLAYIVYTSGSTGKPKAVPISNGNFLTCIRGMQHREMIHSSDIIVQITECSYDVHLMELLGCLVTGGTLIMLKQHGNLDMNYLANIIEQYKATWTILVPTLALSLYEHVSNSIEFNNKLQSLTTCISGAMSPTTIRNLLPFFSTNVQIYNVYGPAEASMVTAFHLIKSEDLTAKFVPIGRPLPNYSCHILDKDFSPLPIGSIGELFIGGPGVFKGYQGDEHDQLKILNDRVLIDIPALYTQSIEHRLEKFYRTGDLCRLNDNGEIIFIGRVDDQVKIRGQRLELGEIEACIRIAALEMNVRNCLAIKCTNESTHSKYLGAYVQLIHGTPPETYNTIRANLTKHCMQYLPAHMIPTSWLFLDTFPLNSNDKIDRKQLPPFPLKALETHRKPSSVQTSINSNNLEDLLCEIYTSVLNVDIGEEQYHMSFIELGGTSLTAMTMVQLIQQRLFAEMELCLLFKHPSIDALATALPSYQTHVQTIEKCT